MAGLPCLDGRPKTELRAEEGRGKRAVGLLRLSA